MSAKKGNNEVIIDVYSLSYKQRLSDNGMLKSFEAILRIAEVIRKDYKLNPLDEKMKKLLAGYFGKYQPVMFIAAYSEEYTGMKRAIKNQKKHNSSESLQKQASSECEWGKILATLNENKVLQKGKTA